MTASLRIASITFNDDSHVALGGDEIIVIVGPNNCGKSQSLKEVYQFAENAVPRTTVTKKVNFQREGDDDELIHAILENGVRDGQHLKFGSVSANEEALRNWWKKPEHGLRDLTKFFITQLKTEDRLDLAQAAPSIDTRKQAPQLPGQRMIVDQSFEDELSQAFREAFGSEISVRRSAGNRVPLHVGKRPIQNGGRLDLGYDHSLGDLPEVEEQGDGMRAFVGVLLYTLRSSSNVLLIDEPEAFLHPPQARLLGRMLARFQGEGKRQTLIATHDENIVHGLLDDARKNVRIVRLSRGLSHNTAEEINTPSEIPPENVRILWSDPILRYSQILEGMFHELVVICESDADCRFYQAMYDACVESGKPALRAPDVLFTHCGGKDRIHVAVNALKAVNVPVKAVVDFDIFYDLAGLKRIFESCGGEWSTIKGACETIRTHVQSKRSELQSRDVIREINDALSRITGDTVPDDVSDEIRKTLRKASPWREAKHVGVNFLSGGTITECKSLMNDIATYGIHIVPEGELESFDREFHTNTRHGPKWVNEVLSQRDPATSKELESARNFVREIVWTN